MSQDCVVVIEDCGTERALEMRAIVQGGSTIASLGERILGRTLATREHVGADGLDVDHVISRVFDALHGQASTWSTWGVEAAVRMHLPAALLDAEHNHPDRVLRPDQAEQDEIIARLVDDITGQMVNVTNTVIDPNGPTGMHRWTSNRLLTAEAELVEAAHAEGFALRELLAELHGLEAR